MRSTDNTVYPMRLQKFLARAGVASRRGSENLMTAGRVSVNGQVVRELGSKVDPTSDVVTVDGREVLWGSSPVYLILHKPAGYLTSMSDPFDRHCVSELVEDAQAPGLFPVGRLDYDTTGLLLFTTDGEAGHALLHPSQHVYKHYIALVEGTVTDADLEPLRTGIQLEDGPCAPAEAQVYAPEDIPASFFASQSSDAQENAELSQRASLVAQQGTTVCGVRIHEGRKHQVKRMFEAIGHEVLSLHRDSFGPLSVEGIQPGRWRELSAEELEELYSLLDGRN